MNRCIFRGERVPQIRCSEEERVECSRGAGKRDGKIERVVGTRRPSRIGSGEENVRRDV